MGPTDDGSLAATTYAASRKTEPTRGSTMDILLFIGVGVFVALIFEIGGMVITRGFGDFVRGVSAAWGARYQLPDDADAVSAGGLRLPKRSRPQSIDSLGGSHWRARLVRWTVLLALLALELYAAQNFFGLVWLGFIAWIGTVLISFAAS
jgi:hypothetical protein